MKQKTVHSHASWTCAQRPLLATNAFAVRGRRLPCRRVRLAHASLRSRDSPPCDRQCRCSTARFAQPQPGPPAPPLHVYAAEPQQRLCTTAGQWRHECIRRQGKHPERASEVRSLTCASIDPGATIVELDDFAQKGQGRLHPTAPACVVHTGRYVGRLPLAGCRLGQRTLPDASGLTSGVPDARECACMPNPALRLNVILSRAD